MVAAVKTATSCCVRLGTASRPARGGARTDAPCTAVRGATREARMKHDMFPSATTRRLLERAAAPRPALVPRTAAARRTPSSRTCSRPPPPAVFLNARRHHVPPAPDALWNAQRHHAARRVHGYRSTHRTPDAAPPPNPCLRPCPRAQPVGGHHARSIKSTPDGRRPVAHRLEIHRPAALPAPGRWAAIPPFTIHLPLEAEAPAQIPQPTRAQNILNTFCSGLLPTDVPE